MKTFFNFPEEVDISHYENIRNEVRDIFRDDSTILSIYEYGSVSSPGVSDIDLMFVLKDLHINNEDSLNLLDASDSAQRLVADGNVIKMPQQTMEKLLYVDELFPSRLMGKEIEIQKPSLEEKNFIKYVALIDWLPERVLKISKIYNSESININNALCTLHSFCYSLRTLNKEFYVNEESLDVINKTAELRNSWYELSNPEKELLELMELALKVGHDQLFSYYRFLLQKELYLYEEFSLGFDVDLELYENCFLRFSNIDKPASYKDSLNLSTFNSSYLIVPSYFLPHFYYQSIQKGLLANNISSKFNKYIQLDTSIINLHYKNTIQKKLEIMEENAQFLIRHNLKTGLLRFGFHF